MDGRTLNAARLYTVLMLTLSRSASSGAETLVTTTLVTGGHRVVCHRVVSPGCEDESARQPLRQRARHQRAIRESLKCLSGGMDDEDETDDPALIESESGNDGEMSTLVEELKSLAEQAAELAGA
jgi:hypothetical protein